MRVIQKYEDNLKNASVEQKGESYLAEQFHQVTHYLAEQFRQIAHYLADPDSTNNILLNGFMNLTFLAH